MNYAEKLKLLPAADRAKAWELFMQLAPCLIQSDDVLQYKRLARQANELLQKNGIEPAFDTKLPDGEFYTALTAHFEQIKKNKREAD